MDLNTWLNDLHQQGQQEIEQLEKLKKGYKMQNDVIVKLHKEAAEAFEMLLDENEKLKKELSKNVCDVCEDIENMDFFHE